MREPEGLAGGEAPRLLRRTSTSTQDSTATSIRYNGRMKSALGPVVLGLLLIGAAHGACLACTGFAVYAEHTLYGMNFDYPPNEIRFSIEDHAVGPVFIGSFWTGEHYGRTVGMNEHGLFASDQMVSPLRSAVETPGEGEVYVWNAFYSGLGECRTVDEVEAWIGDRRLVQYPTLALHNLYADPTGNSIVLEAGVEGNVVTRIDGPFLVMTNFHNGDFPRATPDEVRGDGAERYRIAHATIDDHLEGFDVDDAFETLKRSASTSGDYLTRYSLVLDPAAGEIYLALERDYDHVWKVSLHGRTIETVRGFDAPLTLPLNEDGVTGPELQVVAAARGSLPLIPVILLVGLLAVTGLFLLLRR